MTDADLPVARPLPLPTLSTLCRKATPGIKCASAGATNRASLTPPQEACQIPGMNLFRKAATVTKPPVTGADGAPAASTETPNTSAVTSLERLREISDTPARVVQVERDLAILADEVLWLKERYAKLQARVTAELREIRREVDKLYDAPNEEEDYDDGEDQR